jgi:hypothetical protein
VGRTSQTARTQTVTFKVSDSEKTLLDMLLRSSTKSGYSDLIRSWMYEKAVLAGLPIEPVPDSRHDPFHRGKKGVPTKTG